MTCLKMDDTIQIFTLGVVYGQSISSRKHTYTIIIFDPLIFYMVKLGFTGVYIIFFLFLLEHIDCGYSLEPPRRGGSNKYP